jgi:hypothetical protein
MAAAKTDIDTAAHLVVAAVRALSASDRLRLAADLVDRGDVDLAGPILIGVALELARDELHEYIRRN